jgi:hypothetical protein
MKIKRLIQTYSKQLTERYGSQLLPAHRKALDAMLACRSRCGEFYTHCDSCDRQAVIPLSCGHRSCPQCQHHLGERWQQKQQQKLLPVTYFMVTFTLPYELRDTAWRHQKIVYELLFKASVEALQTIGKNNFSLKFGMTCVLHTHKRDKGYHPHVHIVLPGGGLKTDDHRQAWQPLPQDFLINEFALATVFRGIFLRMLFDQSIATPYGLPSKWVTNIKNVGQGEDAYKYLSRYLYRGVISENDILSDRQGEVTFRYQDSKTRKMTPKTQKAEDFLWALLKHVLPRGFRRVRDYGFLHGNAHKTLKRIQLMLHVSLPNKKIHKKKMSCPECQTEMTVVLVLPKCIPMQFRFYQVREKEVPVILAPS